MTLIHVRFEDFVIFRELEKTMADADGGAVTISSNDLRWLLDRIYSLEKKVKELEDREGVLDGGNYEDDA